MNLRLAAWAGAPGRRRAAASGAQPCSLIDAREPAGRRGARRIAANIETGAAPLI
ncbi:hypothetical protein [Burkholderia stagnalis]|uniref:hypothetical protein n=1 Tax=Burkholderia stagnalis TaxID=1503054 RepID=UPI000A4B6A36|nr:hypothetical protein [Burkholderia stagnalis]